MCDNQPRSTLYVRDIQLFGPKIYFDVIEIYVKYIPLL